MGGILERIEARLDRIEARLAKCSDPPGGMILQRKSPLGARKHMAAVKRRVAEAEARGISPIELGAAIDGEKHYLTQEALAAELGERTRASLAKGKGSPRVANDTASDEEEAAYRAALDRGRRSRGNAK